MGAVIYYVIWAFLMATPVVPFRMSGNKGAYARFPKWNACVNASISFDFKTDRPDSLLMYTDDNGANVTNNFFLLALESGVVSLTYKIDDKMDGSVNIKLGGRLNDNRWHNVKLQRNRLETILNVDDMTESRISLDEDIHFANIPENNDVFFGGLPTNNFNTNLRHLALPSAMFKNVFRGEIRNILYVNCTCKPVRGKMIEELYVDNRLKEACEIRNPCGEDLCITSDRGAQCKRVETGCGSDYGLAFYYLPMDSYDKNIIQNPSGLDSTVYGKPRLVLGAKNNALLVDGRREYIKVSGRRHRRECFGDLELCYEGYTMGMWVKFSNPAQTEGIYLSNGGHDPMSHGVAMTYQNGKIKFIFRSKDGRYWTVSYDNFLSDKWYHVAVTWDRNQGLFLYVNGNQQARMSFPQIRVAVSGQVRYNDFIIGRSNDNQGLYNLGQITVDEFRFWPKLLTQKQIQENGPMYLYYMNMEQIAGQELIVDNAETEIVGNLQLTKGKIGKAVEFKGRGDYIDFGNLKDTCLGDPARCLYGFTISFWLKPTTLPTKTYYFSSSPNGFTLYSEQYTMYSEVRSKDKVWRNSFYGLKVGKWHYIELSWHPDNGTEMYLDFIRASYQGRSTKEDIPRSSDSNFFIGRSHGDRRGIINPSAIIDEVEMYYGDRRSLLDLDLIQRGKPNKYQFGLDIMRGDIIDHPSLIIDTYNNPKLVKGKIGKAVKVNGQSQVVDLGDHSSDCLGNLDLCHHGALLGLWFKVTNLRNDMHFLSNGHNGISITNQGREIIITATTSTRKWQVTTEKLKSHKWYFMEVSWRPETGLELYVDNKLEASDYKPDKHNEPVPTDILGRSVANKFYLGRGNLDMERGTYGKGVFDELEYWYGPRDYLEAFGYLNRGKPKYYMLPMENMLSPSTLDHPQLNLTLYGRPRLVGALIGNGLALNGRGQYLDLGDLSEECVGNLELCKNGITVSLWLKFMGMRDNSYIFSTGNNGIRMYLKDNYLNVKVDHNNREWSVSVPQVDETTWNYVELSWHPDFGLGLYLNNTLVSYSAYTRPTPTQPLQPNPHVLVGKANTGDSNQVTRYADAVVDEMEVWYGRREELLAFDYILRDNIRHEIFSMETQRNNIVNHPKFNVTLENGAKLVPGIIGNAVSLNGYGQYVDIGKHNDRCLANSKKCKDGMTISMWIKARRLNSNTYFLSSPSYALFYKDNNLHARFNYKNKVWEVYTPEFSPDRWHNVEMSWTQEDGLALYIDGEQEGRSSRPRERMQGDQPDSESVLLGKSDKTSRTAAADIDEVQFWYAPRDKVMASGQLGGFVNHQAILFERTARQYGNGTAAIVSPMRTIYLINGPSRTQGDQHNAIRLNGNSQYIYIGDDVICTGNLDNCPQGFTIRMAMRPENLATNTYFLDSFPLSIYYRDAKLFATVRTPTKSWTVSTPGIKAKEWQDIEITWHPQAGLTMMLRGADAAHQTFGTPQEEVQEWDTKLYLGRSLSDMVRERYADAIFERLDIWNARKQYLETHKIIRTNRNGGISVTSKPRIITPQPRVTPRPTPRPTPPPRVTSAPVNPPNRVNVLIPIDRDGKIIYITGDPGTLPPRPTDPRPRVTTTPRTIVTNDRRNNYGVYYDKYFTYLIRFDGTAYIAYDFNDLSYQYPEIFNRARNETFTFSFITNQNNGLIWLDDRKNENLKMYLAVKDGYLTFNINEGNGRIQERILTSSRFREANDFAWHDFRVDRYGRELRFYVDDEFIGSLSSDREVQLIGRGDVYLGGTPVDYKDDVTKYGYDGGITKILYQKNLPNKRLQVSLMQYLAQMVGNGHKIPGIRVITPQPYVPTQQPPTRVVTYTPRPYTPRPYTPKPVTTPRPVPPKVTLINSLSFVKPGLIHINEYDYIDVRRGGKISFKFRTLEPRGILLFMRRKDAKNQLFIAFEIFDGKLYYISDFGARTRRLQVSNSMVNDGTWQNVELEFRSQDQRLFLSFNRLQQEVAMTAEEFNQAYFSDGLYLGGQPDDFTSWYIWSRVNAFLGCFGDIILEDTNTNMAGPIRELPLQSDMAQLRCVDMNKQCDLLSPCKYGMCYNGVSRYYCDCTGSGRTGTQCENFAEIAGFQGNEYIKYQYFTPQATHTNDISVRFKTFLEDALLLTTVSRNSDDFLRAELDKGRVKVTVNVEGQAPQEFYVGSNLNDNRWHTLYVKRRGNQLELTVDSESPVKDTIDGENFYLKYDKIYFGGVGDSGLSKQDHPNYLGVMQNVYWDKTDLFSDLRGRYPDSDFKVIWVTSEGDMNKFIYRPVTYATREVFSQLSPMFVGKSFRTSFNFKTKEESGTILYSKGPGSKFVAIEMIDGYMNFVYDNGFGTKRTVVATPEKINDNTWHMFNVREIQQGGKSYYQVTVDKTSRNVEIPGNQKLDLTGYLYFGGLPSSMYKDPIVNTKIQSRHGFMGCLASVDMNGQSPDMISSANNKDSIINKCTEIQACASELCANGGVCVPGVNSPKCMCDLTGFYGPRCLDYPVGVYFNKKLVNKEFGVIKYDLINAQNSAEDNIAFGFMTEETDGIIMRIDSGGANEFIELRLENGYLVGVYNTGSGETKIRYDASRFNDGSYHVVKFTRTADGGFLTVDGEQVTKAHQTSHSVFNEVKYVYIGGRLDASNNVMNPFTGIIGGAFYKNNRFIDLGNSATGSTWMGSYNVITDGKPGYVLVQKVKPTAPPRIPLPPNGGPYVIPGDIGGGGVVVPGGFGAGGPSGGGGAGVGGPGGVSGGGGGGPGAGGGPFTSGLTGSGAGPVPVGVGGAGSARAGAVMGAILGTMAFLASLMWAFNGLKPGTPLCAGGGGGAKMSISSPTATNLPVTQALLGGGGGSAAGGGGGGGGSKMDTESDLIFTFPELTVVNGGAGGGGGGGGSAFTSFQQTSTLNADGSYGGGGYTMGNSSTAAGGMGGGAGGGYGVVGEYTSNTMRTIGGGGSVSGYGTGTGFGTGTGYGTGGSYTHNRMYSSSTMGGGGSMMDGESTTADYDIATGTGTMMGVGATSTMNRYNTMNTMQTQSNYQVQNVRTVLINNQGTQQLVTYHSTGGAVTPGAAGDEVRVDCCLMNEDGRTVVTGSTLGPPQVWNMQTGELLRIMKGDTIGSTNLHLACNDRLLVGAVHADLEINEYSTRKGVTVKKLQIWDFVTGKPLDMGVDETCSALCVMSDPDKVVFGRSDKFGNASSIVVWDLLGNQPIKEMRYDAPVGYNDYINYLALSQNDRYCVAGFSNSSDNYAEFVVFDMTLTSFNINDANILRLDANPECTAILPHEEACTGLRNGDLVVWNLKTGDPERQLLDAGRQAHSNEIKAVTLSQDNSILISASADNTMKLWDMSSEKPTRTLRGHTDEVWCSAISADNEIIVSGSKDGTIRLWRTKNGSEICAFNTGVDVFNVTLSKDKGTIVALGDKFGARKLIMLQVVRTKVRRQTTS